MTPPQSTPPSPRMLRPMIGLLIAAPLLLLKLVYLANINGWNDLLVFGGLLLFTPLVLVAWLVFLAIEVFQRGKRDAAATKMPWFAIAGLFFILTFFLAGPIAQPIVLNVPPWCRAHQIIDLPTSKPDTRYAGNHRFALVFVGHGNQANHRFTAGYLNWTGDEEAGYNFDLHSQTFSQWVGYEQVAIPATHQTLRERIGNAGLEEAEADQVANAIWQTMQQATAGKPITPALGTAGPTEHDPANNQDIKLGGALWIALLLTTFIATAHWSLPKAIANKYASY